MSTSIPPHNMTELLNAAILYVDNAINDKETTLEDLMTQIQGPDFPDGGVIVSKKDLKKAYETGKGKITLRGKTEIVELKKGQTAIVITEFPYQTKPIDFCKKVRTLMNENKIEGIREVLDESSEENGVKIDIVLKKDVNDELVLNQLYKQTELQKNISFNMNALLEGNPVTVTLEGYMEEYLSHSLNVMTRRIQHDLNKDIKRARIIEAIATAAEHLDKVVEIQQTAEDTIAAFMDIFDFDEEQAKYIDDVKVKTLTNAKTIARLQEEYDMLTANIERYNAILSD